MTPSQMGRKGGKTKGASKRRGNSAYYRKLAAKSAAVRRGDPKCCYCGLGPVACPCVDLPGEGKEK